MSVRNKARFSVGYSTDGSHIVSGSSDKTIQIGNARTGRMVESPLEGHRDSINSVGYSPDGSHIVSSSSDKTIRIWNARTGQIDSANCMAYLTDGKHVASCSDDKIMVNARINSPNW